MTGIMIKIRVPAKAGKIKTNPINDLLFKIVDKNFLIFVLYYKKRRKGGKNIDEYQYAGYSFWKK
jgi:hypothetical protein